MNTYDKNLNTIASEIASGAVSPGLGRIGVEIEHIIVRDDGSAVSYSEPEGVRNILEELAPSYDECTMSEGFLIGLARPDSTITIEPAGQLELSISPYDDLRRIQGVYEEFRSRLDPMLARRGMHAESLGYHPTTRARDLELIPKERYRLMDAWFKNTGKHGICMMRGSASAQVSVDYVDEADAILKFKIANLLGPLFSFITDNAPVFEGKTGTGRMARTRIWNDVDAERSMVVSYLFEHGFDTPYTFLDYAHYIYDAHPILNTRGDRSCSTGDKTAAELCEQQDHLLDRTETLHLLSMFFPDVRLKHYIEVRMADSMPEEYTLAYAALVKGIFYDHDNLADLSKRFRAAHVDDKSVPAAKAALMEDAWLADVFGMPAYRWLDDLIAMAWRGLPAFEQTYLEPLARLVEMRTTLFDESPLQPAVTLPDEAGLEAEYRVIVEELAGDDEGRVFESRALQNSTARYHNEIVCTGYVPMLLPPRRDAAYRHTVETLHGILSKIIDRYLDDPSYRALFGFSRELEQAILADTGYAQNLPICRFDIFPDLDADAYADGDVPFKFCEVNTDGTSTMNEDREVSRIIAGTPSCKAMAKRYTLAPHTLFDGLVRLVARCYGQWAVSSASVGRPTHPPVPHVAIVDFMESATVPEFEHFAKRFRLHGMKCTICDIRSLRHEGGRLLTEDGTTIDCVYRRAVTPELFAHLDEARAFVDAVVAGDVCCVGAFRTQVPHCKRSFVLLRDPATQAFLTDDEKAFIERHIPRTYLLDDAVVDMPGFEKSLTVDKDRWVLKPDDGYGTHGVIAGCECSQDEWEQTVDAYLDEGGYIVQEYCAPHSSPNLVGPLAEDGRVSDEERTWYDLNMMPGLFVYDGQYAGVYSRNGRQGVIGSPWDSQTRAVFHVAPRR